MKVIIVVGLFLVAFAACQEHGHNEPPSPPPAASASPASNPVQQEMRLLTSALEAAVGGIGIGDVRSVEHELHRVHAAKEATATALRDGHYRPPRNADKLDRFHELDEAFHGDLERLAEASHANDVPGTAAALGGVLQRCQGCHSEFRP